MDFVFDLFLLGFQIEPIQVRTNTSNSFEGHNQRVTALLMRHAAGMLVSGSADRSIRLCSVETYEQLRVLQAHGASVTCLTALDGARFVSGGNDRQLHVWSDAGESLGTIERQEEENLHCTLYVGGDQLITGSNSCLLLVYNTAACQFSKVLASTYHRESVRCLISVSTEHFASASLDGTIVLWHADSLTPGDFCL